MYIYFIYIYIYKDIHYRYIDVCVWTYVTETPVFSSLGPAMHLEALGLVTEEVWEQGNAGECFG